MGVWIDHTGRGAVEIKECSGGLCGRIVWLKDAANSSVCGTQVIGSAKKTASDTWDNGWIFDPDKNARYSVELKTLGTDKLRVMGYMGSKMFNETYTWKRASAELKWCDAPATAATPTPAGGDPKPAPTEVTKNDPTPEPAAETPPPGKAAKSGMADLEKIAREMLKTKPGGKAVHGEPALRRQRQGAVPGLRAGRPLQRRTSGGCASLQEEATRDCNSAWRCGRLDRPRRGEVGERLVGAGNLQHRLLGDRIAQLARNSARLLGALPPIRRIVHRCFSRHGN